MQLYAFHLKANLAGYYHRVRLSIFGMLVVISYVSGAFATPTIVQNGRGLVGVMNSSFSTSLSGITHNATSVDTGGILFGPFSYIILTYYAEGTYCRDNNSGLMYIDGVKGIKFDTDGTLMLVPEVTYIDTRTWTIDGKHYTDTVTALFNGYGANTNENFGEGGGNNCAWTPKQSTPNNGIDLGTTVTHNVTATGRVLIYGTGQQKSTTATLNYPFQIMLKDPRNTIAKYGVLVPAGSYSVVVSDLGCTLTTPTVIDFGPQPANAANGQLLTTKSDGNLTVNCQQNTNPMSATLSLSAGINPIYYSGNSYEVNLINSENKAGAYVTMSININGTPTNIPFNRTPVDIGSISASNSSASFSYPITYSLYSRGTGITGKVKGSAELSIVLR